MPIKTQGTKLMIGDGATPTEAFTAVGKVLSFSGPDTTRSEIDATHLQSTAREYVLALKDRGNISFDCLLDPDDTAQDTLWDDLDSDASRNFKLELSDSGGTSGTTYAFAAFVSQFSITGQVDDLVRASLTLRITGDVTKTAAA